MKKIIGLICIILTLALVCAFATSCDKDDTTTTNNVPGIGSTSGTTGTTDTTDTTGTTATTDSTASTASTSGTTGTGSSTATTKATTATTKATTTTASTKATSSTSSTASTGTTATTAQLVIFLDPGHGGSDPGTVREYDFDGKGTDYEKTTYKEADINLAVALKAKEKLEKLGYKVVLSRSEDTYLTPEARPAAALAAKADMFISIHVNSVDNSDVVGFEAYYHGKDGLTYDGKAFADLFTKEFTEMKDIENEQDKIAYPNMTIRGTKKDTDLGYTNGLAVLREKSIPSVLLELGFLSNEKDAFMLQSTYWQNFAAEAIADAVVAAHAAGIYAK